MDASVRKLDEAEEAFRQRDLGRASRLLKRVLLAAPANSRANELMAYVEGERGNLEGVYTHLDKATRASGASPTAWYYLGVWYRRNGRLAQAVAAFHEALRRDPGLFAAAHDLGLSLFDLGEPAEALAAYDRALAINPVSYELSHNRARVLHALGRYEEALESFDEALALRPESVPTLLDRGESCNELGRHAEALENFASAARQSPGNADAQWSEALARLLLGQLEAGWPKYEARWRALNWTRRHADIAPLPSDPTVTDKRVLVWCEQGLGDTLHFCRYAPLLAGRGARVVLEVQPELKGLLSRLPGCEVYAKGEALPDCDYQVPLLSLPLAFGTTLATIPAEVPYLRADPARMALWQPRIQGRHGRLRIGIACSGRAGKKDLRHRAMELQELLPLQEKGDLFLIQTQVGPEDADCLGRSAIRSLAGDIADFEDSAAIVEQLDLVVTVDTSLAHLAGALGRPVFILLPFVPTWRWLVDRADSPWYPTARLFRQQSPGDWKGVVSQVVAVLHEQA